MRKPITVPRAIPTSIPRSKQNADLIKQINANAAAFPNPAANSGYPGQNMGLPPEVVKQIANEQPRAKGFAFVGGAGTIVTPAIQLDATVQYMIGFSFAGTLDPADQFTISINNQILYENAAAAPYFVGAGKPLDGYFPSFQFIGGANTFKLFYQSAVGNNLIFTINYVQSPNS